MNDQEKIIKTTEDELKWTEKLITASKELGILDRGLQSQKYSSAAIFPDGVLKWSFYSKRRYGNSYACIGKLDILRSPLSIKIYIKRGSDRNYKLLNPKKDAVAEGDEWKLSLYVRHKVDMVLFLRDNKQKNIRLPIRQGDESLQSVNQGLLNMSYNEVCFDNVEGTEYLCCFYSTGKLDVPAIEKWLNDNRLESILSNDQKQYGEFVIPYKNNIFYDHPLPTSLYLISFRHIKRDQN